MADGIEGNNSEDDISPEAHNKLLDAVSKIYKKKRVEAPTRKEPTLEISEFHLTQPKNRKKTTKVNINDLIKALNKKSKHGDLTHKLKQTQKQSKTLFKPLEKPQAERINRSIGYHNVKAQLNRWDPIVYQQRVATSLTFPLRQSQIKEPKSNDFLSKFRNPTELEIKVAEILKQSDEMQAKYKEEKRKEKDKKIEDDEFPLTLAEMVERRQMMQKIRAQQSYRQIKEARHSKIKSKKFHRIQKREKIKNELKEFEELQKKDPEAALKKLEQLEKTRAEERASLRHKSTGQWAKNLTVRAKYDKEARIALAEQLKKSRELTQKLQINKDTSDEEEDSENDNIELVSEKSSDPNNPWVQKSEVQEFFNGYKKYLDKKNKINELNKCEQAPPAFKDVQNLNKTNKMETSNSINNHTVNELFSKGDTVSKKEVQRVEDSLDRHTSNDIMKKDKTINKQDNNYKDKQNLNKRKRSAVTLSKESVHKHSCNNSEIGFQKQNEIKTMFSGASGTWIVSTVEQSDMSKGEKSLDNLSSNSVKVNRKRNRKDKNSKQDTQISLKDLIDKIENLEDKIAVVHKKNIVSDKLSQNVIKMKKLSSESISNPENSQTKISADTDGKLDEVSGHSDKQNTNLDNIKDLVAMSTTVTTKTSTVDDIDPKKFLTVTPKYLRSGVPDLMTAGDQLDDEDDVKEEERHMTISEAFADDDIVDEFRKEKEEEIKKDQIENIDLSLPGWGSWGGPNLSTAPRRKRKRFMVKFPKVLPRKDDKKANVIINEDKDLPVKDHRVSDIPFPFKSVKDYEASIRAPIGSNWVPQSAHRKLILPAVITKLGAVIEPMDESYLAKQAT